MKKLFALLVIVGVAIGGVLGGISVANADHDGGRSSALTDRIAEILGIAPDEVASAIAQARSEAQVERMKAKLAEAVDAGIITPEESAAITDWFAGKPDALHAVRRHGLRSAVKAGELEAFLAGLVDQEIITATESAEISTWLNARPSALEQLREWRMEQFKNGEHRFHGRKGWGRRHHGWGRHGFCEGGDNANPEVSDANPA
ncbi:MAG: hypothetical protein QF357_06755 [Dehalococcoidia bacterium]|jgi:hypothetical protein|nr:hypothetical protein [Dehalococcoidia bacterium]